MKVSRKLKSTNWFEMKDQSRRRVRRLGVLQVPSEPLVPHLLESEGDAQINRKRCPENYGWVVMY
jgi:hypothetical protein